MAPSDLCAQCQTYDLQEWFFPQDGHVLSQRAPDSQDHFKLVASLDIGTIDCRFCKYLLDCIELSSELQELRLKEGLGSLWLSVQKIGTVRISKSNRGQLDEQKNRGWHDIDGSIVRNVQYLIINKSTDTPWTFPSHVYVSPALTPALTGPSALLLHRHSGQPHVDWGLLTSWIHKCDRDHEAGCRESTVASRNIEASRMIDVVKRCVVDVREPVRYFALSYCWGASMRSQTSIRLLSSNKKELYAENALAAGRDDLPLTICDAMLVTQELGVRHLWVDALCICQDDIEDKLGQINCMDSIYNDASLTIVAAGGDDSWSGLPGIRPRPAYKQLRTKISRIDLVAQRPSREFDSAVGRSIWATRAWTLQEHLLSPGLLIFTPDEVTWECRNAIWTEGLELENPDLDVEVERVKNHEFGTKPSDTLSTVQLYRYLIYNVSERKLAYENDRLNCLQGMLNVLKGQGFPAGFHWGLPIDILDSALLFATSGNGPVAPLERVGHFPSWSWAGWKEEPHYTITSPYDPGFTTSAGTDARILGTFTHPATRDTSCIRKEVAWHCIEKDGITWQPLESSLISDDGSFCYKESRHRWERSDFTELLDRALKGTQQSNVPTSHVLACWTQTVHLKVDRVLSERNEPRGFGTSKSHKGFYTVRDDAGKNICYLSLKDEYRAAQPDKLYFMLIAHHRRFEQQYGPIMEVMHIETKAGLTYRVTGVRDCIIDVDMWKSFKPKWEAVIMV